MAPTIYVVRMFVNAIKKAPRVVVRLVSVITLTFLILGVAAASLLGVTLALEGWAATMPPIIPSLAPR